VILQGVTAWTLLALALALGCDAGDPPANPLSFCRNWLQLAPSGRDSVLDETISEWASESEHLESSGARFLACLAIRANERSFEITRACRQNLGSLRAPAVLGDVLLEAGESCAGIDIH
jgi:hypothetical protein